MRTPEGRRQLPYRLPPPEPGDLTSDNGVGVGGSQKRFPELLTCVWTAEPTPCHCPWNSSAAVGQQAGKKPQMRSPLDVRRELGPLLGQRCWILLPEPPSSWPLGSLPVAQASHFSTEWLCVGRLFLSPSLFLLCQVENVTTDSHLPWG